MTRPLTLVLATTCYAILGCGGEAGKVSVSGKVLLDGQPLENGTIVFTEVAGGGRPEMSVITTGAYRLEVPPGAYKVLITSERLTPPSAEGKRAGQKEATMVQYLPLRYNGPKSELSASVQAKSSQSFDFDLKARK